MAPAYHPNPFDLLGQTELYVYPVHLRGSLQPKLYIAWNSFHSNFFSSVGAFFRGAKIDKHAPPSKVFPDVYIERRSPKLAILIAAVLHVIFFAMPWPDFAVAPAPNSAFENTQLTWSGPVTDLPLLQIPKTKTKSAPKAARIEQPAPADSQEAFHPRQRIYTDPVHPTHPRQTLINSAAPNEPPKILPQMPNVVQLAASEGPAKPRMEINEKELAKLHPKTVKPAATTDAPMPEIAHLDEHPAVLSITTPTDAPAKPKLEINAGSAPRVAERKQAGDNSGAPEVPLGGSPNATAASTLIALSANPAPPAPVVPAPQGNLAARVAMSPVGQPGASGAAANHSNGGGGGDSGSAGTGTGNHSVGISINGGNPNANSSGFAGGTRLTLPKSSSAMKRPDPNDTLEDPPERVGPPNFAMLPPGAKPEAIFSTKHVYAMNVNMPNLNSATGNWIIHFSELHLADPLHRTQNVTSPVPVRKVDPKYPQSFLLEHVEGQVVLYGVIKKDGTVGEIIKVKGLDEVLDANAIDAFSQWKFAPAMRDGEPVDLEAIVYIPFKGHPRE